LLDKTEASIERNIAGLHVDAYPWVIMRTGIIEQRFHDRRADFLLAPLRQHRNMPDVTVGPHPSAADGIALKAEGQCMAAIFVQPVPLRCFGNPLFADEYRLAD
jgi:hypothetical protein